MKIKKRTKREKKNQQRIRENKMRSIIYKSANIFIIQGYSKITLDDGFVVFEFKFLVQLRLTGRLHELNDVVAVYRGRITVAQTDALTSAIISESILYFGRRLIRVHRFAVLLHAFR